jgi:ClpX C4-type zinc finger
MASLISSTSWGDGMAGGPLRCLVCGRREAAVEHLVRARGVHICDRCVAQASEALAAATSGQKVVRIRPASAHVGDREAAEAAVEAAFETVFNGQVPIEARCRAIENGDNLAATFEQARQRHPGAGPLDVSVDYVRFLSEDEAEVRFTLWLAGFGHSGMPRSGHAVRVGVGWKVARDTWCGLVRMVGSSARRLNRPRRERMPGESWTRRSQLARRICCHTMTTYKGTAAISTAHI